MFDFQEMNSMQMLLASCKRQLFARFNHLGLCRGINATRIALDRVRRDHEEILQWKSDMSDFLLLPSEASTSDTILYSENASQSEALIIPFAEDVLPMETVTDLADYTWHAASLPSLFAFCLYVETQFPY